MADTANFGWTKPTVGADADAWGGILNTALDDIDTDMFGRQPKDATLTALAAASTAADKFWVWSGVDVGALQTVTAAALSLLDDTDASAMRTTLGLGTAAEVADSTLVHLSGSETLTGTKEHQAATFSTTAPQPTTDNALDFGASAKRWAAGFFGTIELGNASDTTLARASAGHISVEGQVILDAANVATYALPISGGTLTGTTKLGNSGAVLQFTDSTNATNGYITGKGTNVDGATGANDFTIRYDGTGWISRNGSPRMKMDSTAFTMQNSMDIVLTGAAPTNVYSAGYRGTPILSGNSAYAFPAADAGARVYHDEASTRTYTIPANASVAHPVGTTFVIDNTGNSGSAGTITLAITSDTLRRGDGTSGTGSRTISANQVAVITKVASTIWVITGGFS